MLVAQPVRVIAPKATKTIELIVFAAFFTSTRLALLKVMFIVFPIALVICLDGR